MSIPKVLADRMALLEQLARAEQHVIHLSMGREEGVALHLAKQCRDSLKVLIRDALTAAED